MAEPCFRLIVDGKELGVFRKKEKGRLGYLEHRRGIMFEECFQVPSLSLSQKRPKKTKNHTLSFLKRIEVMRAKKAKVIRKAIYGELAHRVRNYKFLGNSGNGAIGTIVNTLLRHGYLVAKQLYKGYPA